MRYMKMALICSALAALLPACVSAQPTNAALTLAQDGQTNYSIVLAEGAIPAEKTAASQLQEHLQKVTGATFAIKPEGEVSANAPQILVGAGSRTQRLLPKQNWSALGSDGIVIQTVGQNLILAGGRPRGVLYAVFEFLEKEVGCRWWTPAESTIPHRSRLAIAAQNTAYTPQIQTREVFYNSVQQDALFATQMKINGHYQKQNEKLGGHNSILGFVHTFYRLLPPEKYFKSHPEWYSDPNNGNKPCTAASAMPNGLNSQLNLTNDEMRRELTKVALEWIAKDPDAGMISISQNDNQAYCQSPGDMALIEREGSPAGALLHFVNQVAADIEKTYPDFQVETIAYQYTRKPPRTIRPRQNVVIRLCSIEADFARPLDSPANADFRADVLGWKAISPRLYVWDYVTNFANSILPHPNLRVLAPNIRFLAANNAIGLFEQGDAYSNGTGDFVQLRVWLLSHLLWNPDQDEKQLTGEFMQGYYGAAAPSLQQYLDVMADAFETLGPRLTITNGNYNFLTVDVMNRATALFISAQKAVEGDEVLSKRVRRARLPLDHAWILRYYLLQREAQSGGKEFLGPQDIKAATEEFITTARAFGVEQYREGVSFESYIPQLQARIVPPAPAAALPAELQGRVLPGDEERNVIDAQQSGLRLSAEHDWVSVVDDEMASDQKAARMPGNHTEWAVQYPVYADAGGDLWHCYVVARIDLKVGGQGTGNALSIGIYDMAKNSVITTQPRPLAELGDGQYHLLDIGAYALTPDALVWISPVNNPDVAAVYIDRVILLREKKVP